MGWRCVWSAAPPPISRHASDTILVMRSTVWALQDGFAAVLRLHEAARVVFDRALEEHRLAVDGVTRSKPANQLAPRGVRRLSHHGERIAEPLNSSEAKLGGDARPSLALKGRGKLEELIANDGSRLDIASVLRLDPAHRRRHV